MKKNQEDEIKKNMRQDRADEHSKSLQQTLRLLKKKPEDIELLVTCGNIFYLQKIYDKAAEYYLKALQKEAKNINILANLAGCFYEGGDYANAAQFALKKLRLEYDESTALVFGSSLLEMEKFSAAARFFQKKMTYEQNILGQKVSLWDKAYYAEAVLKSGNISQALDSFLSITAQPTTDENLHLNLGYVFYDFIREHGTEKIKKIIELWIKNNPDSPNVCHWSDAFLQRHETTKADCKYVKTVFDVFASGFEKLLHDLDYRVPEFIEGFCRRYLKPKILCGFHILDVGCGTGLCGKFLKKYSRFSKLDGVDLSAEMLRFAKEKKCYSGLFCQEMTSFMNERKNTYDVVVASDVLTYLGDLDSFFSGVDFCLCKNGFVFFSVSENNQDEQDFFLHFSGRFLHSFSYVKKLSSARGFSCLEYRREILRTEGGEPVWGYVFAMKKNS